MAKQTLPTNFKDDVLNASMSGKRKWNISQNSDGTYSITDVTTYDQVGSEFGAGELNATNQAVNASADAGKIIDDPDTAEATTEEGYIAGVQLFNHVNESLGGCEFSVESDGAYITYKVGADSVTKKLGSFIPNGWVFYKNPTVTWNDWTVIDVSEFKTVDILFYSGVGTEQMDVYADGSTVKVNTISYGVTTTIDVENYNELWLRQVSGIGAINLQTNITSIDLR